MNFLGSLVTFVGQGGPARELGTRPSAERLICISAQSRTHARIAEEPMAVTAVAIGVFSLEIRKDAAYRPMATRGGNHISFSIFISKKTSNGCNTPMKRVCSSFAIGSMDARQITKNTAAIIKYECRHCSQKFRQRWRAGVD